MAVDRSNTQGSIAFYPDQKSQDALVAYAKKKSTEMFVRFSLRDRFEKVDRLYARELDRTREQQLAKMANEYGDSDRVQNLQIPVVMPQVQAAVVYQASVFLTGTPMFGVATVPEFVDAGMMMESIIEKEQIEASWVRNLNLFLIDGMKYNFSAVEVDWKSKSVASLSTNVAAGKNAEVKKELWSGNFIKRLSPYNVFHDPSVAPADVSEYGEYAGFNEMYTRARFRKMVTDLRLKINTTKAYDAPMVDSYFGNIKSYYYRPAINPDSHVDPDSSKGGEMDWTEWMDLSGSKDSDKYDYRSSYLVTTIYARITPSEFNLRVPGSNTPQIFKLIVVNMSVLLHVEICTNAHDLLPILFGVPLEDGLEFEDKSLAENAAPFQHIATSMTNRMLAGARRSVADRLIYDPSKLPQHLMNKAGISRIACRPSAYGTDMNASYSQIPFVDNQAGTIMQEVNMILGLANEANGQNKARQGQFVKGNKTQSEFNTVMANANGRDQARAMLLEDQVFSKIKKIVKINILQYHGPEKIFSRSANQVVDVDPDKMRNAVMEFKISDGLTPTDKLMDAESFAVALQTMQATPQLAADYNVGPMFGYLMKQRGADLKSFEKPPEQKAYEQAVGAWQQAVAAFAKGLEKGTVTEEQLPPQPTPDQFGWNPQTVGSNGQQPRVSNNVNNITNNITNNRQEAS